MRVILHSDLNAFYASVECLHQLDIRHKPVAVCGNQELRHGIVLAKNQLAKQCGIKTGDAIWQARQKAPGLVLVPPNFPLYMKFSQLVRNLYLQYTPNVESFGLDEAWLDLTQPDMTLEQGHIIAEELRRRVKEEVGLTVSIGISWNKIFAKLGSDYQKPDAVTLITPENYRSLVWPLPASDLLYVGPATSKKLARYGITTIGGIANTRPALLHAWLKKWGLYLHTFANGRDKSPVQPADTIAPIQSIGNSLTTPHDLDSNEDVKLTLYMLSESVAARLAVKPYRSPSGIQGWDGSAGNSGFRAPPIYPAKLQTPPWRSFAVITIGKAPFAAWACAGVIWFRIQSRNKSPFFWMSSSAANNKHWSMPWTICAPGSEMR